MVVVGIIHNSLNPLGGAERLCLATVEAFKECGWEVVLATVEPTDWDRVSGLWDIGVRPDREVVLSGSSRVFAVFKRFSIYKRLLTGVLMPDLRRVADVVINTHGDVLLVNADITYMHFPTFQLMDTGYSKYSHGFWRLYFTPYYMVQKYLSQRRMMTLLLTNSWFTASVIKRVLSRNALVVYPPVDVGKYFVLEGRRENIVVSIGRFSPEKRYEIVLGVAREMPDVQFYIIGSIANKEESKKYYEKIRNMIESERLKNVEIIPNASDKKMMEIMSMAKVFLHARLYEHFGIAVVEGMASGLVPVVHRSGGVWTDIVKYGKYGYGYSSIREAMKHVREALENYDKIIPFIRKSSLRFTKDKYKKKIVHVVKKYAELSR